MRVITIGTGTRDVVLRGDFFRVVHDPKHLKKFGFPTGEAQCFTLGSGGKIEIQEPIFALGGGAANAAVTFARQGFVTEALIKIGRDQVGEEILRTLKKEGVRPVPIFDKKLGTSYSLILISPDGERTILNYRGASKDLVLSEIPKRDFKVDCAYVVPGAISVPVVVSILKKLKQKGAFVAMNPSRHYIEIGAKKLRPILDLIDVIILNREEGAFLTGKRYLDEKGIFRKFDEMVGGLAVMTDGPKGVMVSDGRRIYKAGIYKEKRVADRTGAGDSFGSGFVAGLLRQVSGARFPASTLVTAGRQVLGKRKEWSQKEIEYAIRLGSANATSNVEEIGAQSGILTRRQFETQNRWKNLPINNSKI
ncbi:MAG: carbohydrate kinase family protein [Patescibacteria group bacterium]